MLISILRPIMCCVMLILVTTRYLGAEEREMIGYGNLFVNDVLGDTKDRWRTAGYSSSRVLGFEQNGLRPGRLGGLIEFRIGAEIISPQSLSNPAAGDRPYAGMLSFGLHSHSRLGNNDLSFGADLVFTGESTRLGDFQREVHEAVDATLPSEALLARQVRDAVHPTLVVELGRSLPLRANTVLRPFVEGRVGVETMARAGFDLSFGTIGTQPLLIRDPSSGQRYRVRQGDETGFSFVMGGDIARVTRSELLPATSGSSLAETRDRLRAGLHWQGETASAFYGVSWLGEEFEGQEDRQVIGAIQIKFRF